MDLVNKVDQVVEDGVADWLRSVNKGIRSIRSLRFQETLDLWLVTWLDGNTNSGGGGGVGGRWFVGVGVVWWRSRWFRKKTYTIVDGTTSVFVGGGGGGQGSAQVNNLMELGGQGGGFMVVQDQVVEVKLTQANKGGGGGVGTFGGGQGNNGGKDIVIVRY